MRKILVLNLGMKSIRSIVFDECGNKLATSSIPLTTALKEEQVTQNPHEWWEKGCSVIRNTLDNIKVEEIDFLTVTSSAACLLAVDSDLNPLTDCMMVSDRRAEKESRIISGLEPFMSYEKKTGMRMDSHLMLPKALWVKEHLPDIYNKTKWFLTPNDYLISKLTDGCVVTDSINAIKWCFDYESNDYPRELIREIGLDIEKMPSVIEPGTEVACVGKNVIKEIGLTSRTKVVISSYDAISSFIGSGAVHEGEACDITGTVTVLRTVVSNPPKRCVDGMQIQSLKIANLHILGGSNNMGGGLIEWAKQCYYQNEQLPYELMEKDAMEAGVGAGGLIFLPYLLGERVPLWDSDAKGVYFGLERTHTRKEMTRAVFESTGYIDLDMIHSIENNGGKVNCIRLSGGLARVPLISQIKADVTGREIHVLDEFESTATGAAMLVLLGEGVYKSIEEVAEVFSRVRMIICPNDNAHKKYMELYQLYRETYNTLKELFAKRTEVVGRVIDEKKIKIENL